MSPALAGGFLTTGPPGKSPYLDLKHEPSLLCFVCSPVLKRMPGASPQSSPPESNFRTAGREEMSQVCPDPEVMLRMHAKSLHCISLCVTSWPAAHQAPLSMGFSRQESWSGLPGSPLFFYYNEIISASGQ